MADLNYFFLSSTLKNQLPIAKYVTFYIYTTIHSWRGSCSFVKPNLFLAILDNPGSKKLIIDVIHEISVVKPLTFLSGEVVFSIWNNIHLYNMISWNSDGIFILSIYLWSSFLCQTFHFDENIKIFNLKLYLFNQYFIF